MNISPTASLFLVGATATGKSAAAMELARREPERWAILAMDAMQVYRGADIGTGKPTATERAEIPHGGLDLGVLGSSFDVAQYLAHAAAFLQEQQAANRRVIIVGGTGLYFRALTHGLCEAPQGSEVLRAELAKLSTEQLRERLEKIDPTILPHLDAANPRRLARAIEVMEATGISLRAWQDKTPEPLVKDYRALWIQRGKEELSSRIEARVGEMFRHGWAEEVRGLLETHGVEKVKGFAGIGYRQIAEATELRGQGRSQVQLGHEGALQRDISVATRQYAKRQLTWFAREPILDPVMLTGTQSLSAALPDLL